MLTRREFLSASTAACAIPSLSRGAFAATSRPADEKLILSAPLTHSDWMLHPNVEWGEPGVRHMLDLCKASGWSRIFWRVLDGGRAMYKSKILDPADNWDADSIWTPTPAEE